MTKGASLSRITTYLLRKLWLTIACIVVLVAIFMSALRYTLPLLDEKKAVLESYVFDSYGVSLDIQSISSEWQSYGPSMVLSGVVLEANAESPIALTVDKIFVELDFWQSLLNLQLKSKNFALTGVKADLDLGKIQSSTQDFPIVAALESLFLDQLERFSLVDSEIQIRTINAESTYSIETLAWLNKGNRHQGNGRLRVDDVAENSAFIVIDLVDNNDQLDGLIYARADDIDMTVWMQAAAHFALPLTDGRGSFNLWAKIQDRAITAIRGDIKPSYVRWSDSKQEVETQLLSGQFVASPKLNTNAWNINLNDFVISVNGETFSSDWGAQWSPDTLQVKLLSALELTPMTPLISVFDQQAYAQINTMNARATLSEMWLGKNEQNTWLARINANNISWQGNAVIPGLSDANLTFDWYNQTGTGKFVAPRQNLDTETLLTRVSTLSKLELPFYLASTEDSLLLQIEDASLQLDDQLSVNIESSFDSLSRDLQIAATVAELPLSSITNYLPKPYLGEGTYKFLQSAFPAQGLVKKARIIHSGKIDEFPHVKGRGVFQASVDIEDADFVFSAGWSRLNDMYANLLFEGNKLVISAPSASMSDIQLNKVLATIPELKSKQTLTIEAEASGTGYSISQLLAQSPLQASIGRVLSKDVLVSNALNADLRLDIPLSKAANTRASGLVTLDNNFVQIPALDLELQQVTGKLRFDNDRISIDSASATLLEQLTNLSISGANSEQGYDLKVQADGLWDVAKLSSYFSPKLADWVQGESAWSIDSEILLKAGDYTYSASLTAPFIGVESALPAPFAKKRVASMPLNIRAQGDSLASNLTASMGEQVKFDGVIPHLEKQFSRAHLALGESDFIGLGVGFSIGADLPSVDVSEWYQALDTLLAGINDAGYSLFPTPERVFVEAKQLAIANQQLSDVDLTAKFNGDDWHLDVSADEAKAKLILHQAWLQKGIAIDADFVRLADWRSDESKIPQEIIPQQLPPISFKCKQCQLFNNDLGKVRFESYPNDDGMHLDLISVEGNSGKLNASGQWYKRNGDHYTFVSGDLESDDFGAFLSNFNLNTGIKDSESDMDFALTWKAAPFDFNFANLDGEINWRLSDGYLTELSDKGSRIFTLLSLESLVRKLSLDFRDVFAKGFFYDRMQGSIQITEGKADTRDTIIDGGAGDMQIYGYTDLVSQSLNYNVNFTPNVTGNLPVLVYFMVSPPTAIAALALDQVLTSTKVISNVNYSITGTLSEPVVLETGRESTEVELPARRTEDDEVLPPFIPPTVEDTLNMELNNG